MFALSVLDVFWLLVAVLVLILVFACICLVVDSHLVPAVEVIIEEFSLPEEIAAVTLIAFGSSTPEILLNTISAVDKASSLSMPALLGSAMIAFGFIPAICILYTGKTELLVDTGPVARETIFYLCGLFLFMNIIHDGVSTTHESLAMITLYIGYVAFVVGRYMWTLSKQQNEEHLQINESVEDSIEETPETIPASDSISAWQNSLHFLIKPLSMIFYYTIPSVRIETESHRPSSPPRRLEMVRISDEERAPSELESQTNSEQLESLHVCHPHRYLSCLIRRQTIQNQLVGTSSNTPFFVSEHSSDQGPEIVRASLLRALLCIIVCIAYIGLFASLIVESSSLIVEHIGLSQTTIGATLVSLGTEIPDIVSSIVLSRDGYIGAALAGATGSQIINITLGTGLPALMMCIYGNGEFHVDDQAASLNLLVMLVLTIILGYLWLTTPLHSLSGCLTGNCPSEAVVTKLGAYHQLILFLVAYLTYIFVNE